jgi:hypothetical protein
MNLNTVPLVDNGKKPEEQLHVLMLFNLPSITPYGNLTLKYSKIITRLDHVNRRIQELNDCFVKTNQMMLAEIPILDITISSRNTYISEEITFNVRQVCDDLISLVGLLDYYCKNNEYPKKLTFDSIGTYLDKKNKNTIEILNNHKIFLDKLNKISNAHKHSFLNTDYNLYGKEESFVFALALENNNLKNKPVFHSIPVRMLIQEFNIFYKETIQTLKNKYS